MAKKDPSQWSPAYARRIARAEAQGKSRQQARGHKANEHKTRVRSPILEGQLTSSQRGTLRRHANRIALASSSHKTAEEIYQKLFSWSQSNGWSDYQQLLQIKKDIEKRREEGEFVSTQEIYDELKSIWPDNPPDVTWVFYK